MKQECVFVVLWCILWHSINYGQSVPVIQRNTYFYTPEFTLGKTLDANTDFPKTRLQKGLFISLGKYTSAGRKTWMQQLGYPRTGITLGYTDFGNKSDVGSAYSVLPFIEFGLFQRKTQRWHAHVGFGTSYIDKEYHPITNPFNRGITTPWTWSFRSFLYYDLWRLKHMNWRLGFGYLHQSNGHTKLPNQGLNSFVASLSTVLPASTRVIPNDKVPLRKKWPAQTFFSLRSGIGQSVLSETFNDRKEVYTLEVSAGRIINKTFKYGIGGYYRFYEHYYEYIRNNEELIEEQVPQFRDHPFRYASNYGISASGELLLSHIGLELGIGVNFYKPFYKIDWQLSQGKTQNGVYIPEELNDYYKIKRTISSKMGLKCYLLDTDTAPINNLFLGVHINANLGQADFSELSLGYVYSITSKKHTTANL